MWHDDDIEHSLYDNGRNDEKNRSDNENNDYDYDNNYDDND
jgi:hypothetical protein